MGTVTPKSLQAHWVACILCGKPVDIKTNPDAGGDWNESYDEPAHRACWNARHEQQLGAEDMLNIRMFARMFREFKDDADGVTPLNDTLKHAYIETAKRCLDNPAIFIPGQHRRWGVYQCAAARLILFVGLGIWNKPFDAVYLPRVRHTKTRGHHPANVPGEAKGPAAGGGHHPVADVERRCKDGSVGGENVARRERPQPENL